MCFSNGQFHKAILCKPITDCLFINTFSLSLQDLVITAGLRDLTYSTLTVGVWEHRAFKDKLLGEVKFSTVQFWKGFVSDPSRVVQEWYQLEAPSSVNSSNSDSLPRHLLWSKTIHCFLTCQPTICFCHHSYSNTLSHRLTPIMTPII